MQEKTGAPCTSLDAESHMRLALALPVGFVPIHGPDNGSMKRGATGSLLQGVFAVVLHAMLPHMLYIYLSYL